MDIRPVHWYSILARQFLIFLILILIIAAILTIIIFNSFLEFFHELRAETTLRVLKKMLSP
ncbi:hypothetical protein [Legionella longbeachae]|uniref:hypothetical protein n=1 Tax=Legionella longbeachae TaxID=450 RepID=UPI0039F0F1C8